MVFTWVYLNGNPFLVLFTTHRLRIAGHRPADVGSARAAAAAPGAAAAATSGRTVETCHGGSGFLLQVRDTTKQMWFRSCFVVNQIYHVYIYDIYILIYIYIYLFN